MSRTKEFSQIVSRRYTAAGLRELLRRYNAVGWYAADECKAYGLSPAQWAEAIRMAIVEKEGLWWK